MSDQRFGIPNFLNYPHANPQLAVPPSPFGAADISGQTAAAMSNLIAVLQPYAAALTGSTTGPAAATPLAADQRASEALLRDITAASLRKLLDYFESSGDKTPALAHCYQPFHAAIRAYRARDYAGALDTVYQIYRTVESLRTRHPDLPELGKGTTGPVRHARA